MPGEQSPCEQPWGSKPQRSKPQGIKLQGTKPQAQLAVYLVGSPCCASQNGPLSGCSPVPSQDTLPQARTPCPSQTRMCNRPAPCGWERGEGPNQPVYRALSLWDSLGWCQAPDCKFLSAHLPVSLLWRQVGRNLVSALLLLRAILQPHIQTLPCGRSGAVLHSALGDLRLQAKTLRYAAFDRQIGQQQSRIKLR